MDAQTDPETAYHLGLPEWPKLAIGKPGIDGLIPVCRMRHWRRFEIADPMFARIVSAAAENRTLAETRDYLLPRLMSGEVRIAEAAARVEDAA